MDLSSQGPTRPKESDEMESTEVIHDWSILYTKTDSLINKREELKLLVKSITLMPHIIAITEVKNKRKQVLNPAELNLKDYNLYTNDLDNCSTGVLIYVNKEIVTYSWNV